MLFSIASRLFKTYSVTVKDPSGGGEFTVERVCGFDPGPVATEAEQRRRHLREARRGTEPFAASH